MAIFCEFFDVNRFRIRPPEAEISAVIPLNITWLRTSIIHDDDDNDDNDDDDDDDHTQPMTDRLIIDEQSQSLTRSRHKPDGLVAKIERTIDSTSSPLLVLDSNLPIND